jgi:hypothetical protein
MSKIFDTDAAYKKMLDFHSSKDIGRTTGMREGGQDEEIAAGGNSSQE